MTEVWINFAYLMLGTFFVWTIGIIIVAWVSSYIEWLVKTMREEGEI